MTSLSLDDLFLDLRTTLLYTNIIYISYTINYIIFYVFKLYSMRILDIISKNVIFNERVILIKCKFDYTKSKIEDLKKMKIN